MPVNIRGSQASYIESPIQGESKDLKDVQFNSIESALLDWVKEFEEKCISNLQKTRSVDSGNLADNIKHKLVYNSGVYTLSVTMPDYYDYVNKGVQGVKSSKNQSPYKFKTLTVSVSMMTALRKWMIRHNLKARIQNKTFKHKSVKTFDKTSTQAAYALGMGIKKFGLEKRPFLDDALQELYPKLTQNIAVALRQDIASAIRRINITR